jgi:hypothetical protein
MKTTAVATQTPTLNPSLSEGSSHLQPDILLACQVRSQANAYHKSESLLMLALLSDALHVLSTFHPNRARRSSKERRQWEADRAWVEATSEAPFSFAYVCDHLGLDRDAMRSHVERLIADENFKPQALSEINSQP